MADRPQILNPSVDGTPSPVLGTYLRLTHSVGDLCGVLAHSADLDRDVISTFAGRAFEIAVDKRTRKEEDKCTTKAELFAHLIEVLDPRGISQVIWRGEDLMTEPHVIESVHTVATGHKHRETRRSALSVLFNMAKRIEPGSVGRSTMDKLIEALTDIETRADSLRATFCRLIRTDLHLAQRFPSCDYLSDDQRKDLKRHLEALRNLKATPTS